MKELLAWERFQGWWTGYVLRMKMLPWEYKQVKSVDKSMKVVFITGDE